MRATRVFALLMVSACVYGRFQVNRKVTWGVALTDKEVKTFWQWADLWRRTGPLPKARALRVIDEMERDTGAAVG